MDADLQKLLDSLNEKGKEKKSKKDAETMPGVQHAKLIGDMVFSHEEMYGTASACAVIATLVTAGFKMALEHSHKNQQ